MSNHQRDALIFMKVGNHAGETFEQIIARKRRELEAAGRIFWGYGGNTCHPIYHVQPFCRIHLRGERGIYLLMECIDSRAVPEVAEAREFSVDGIRWEPLPQGVSVIGSRYALVLDEIVPGDLDLDLEDYVVGVGSSRGKRAQEYLRGRVDKGCFERAVDIKPSSERGSAKHVSYMAKLKDPFAVLLRGHE